MVLLVGWRKHAGAPFGSLRERVDTMKKLLISAFAVALAAAIILLTPSPMLADQYETCTAEQCSMPGESLNCGWQPTRQPDNEYGYCICHLPNPTFNPCPLYSNP
jgi:hypothetical protein